MALRVPTPSPVHVLAALLRPLPGRVVALVDDPDPDGPILKPGSVDARRRLWQRAGVANARMQRRFGRDRLLNGIIVASGPQRPHGQPAPEPGTRVFVWEDKYDLRIYPEDEDFPGIGDLVPPGTTLQFFGLREPWQDGFAGERP